LGNYLQLADIKKIEALLELGRSQQRIAREVGCRRETVARYQRLREAKPANPIVGWEIELPTSGPVPMAQAHHCFINDRSRGAERAADLAGLGGGAGVRGWLPDRAVLRAPPPPRASGGSGRDGAPSRRGGSDRLLPEPGLGPGRPGEVATAVGDANDAELQSPRLPRSGSGTSSRCPSCGFRNMHSKRLAGCGGRRRSS
jgi:hypothetical protein